MNAYIEGFLGQDPRMRMKAARMRAHSISVLQ